MCKIMGCLLMEFSPVSIDATRHLRVAILIILAVAQNRSESGILETHFLGLIEIDVTFLIIEI